MTITIVLAREVLDDGSPGYTLSIGNAILLAKSERDRDEMADAVAAAIHRHAADGQQIITTGETR
jgi:hypothetical protein